MDASLLFMRSRPCFRTVYCFICVKVCLTCHAFHPIDYPCHPSSSFSLLFKYITHTHPTNIYIYICIYIIVPCQWFDLKKFSKNVYSLGFEMVYISFLFMTIYNNDMQRYFILGRVYYTMFILIDWCNMD